MPSLDDLGPVIDVYELEDIFLPITEPRSCSVPKNISMALLLTFLSRRSSSVTAEMAVE